MRCIYIPVFRLLYNFGRCDHLCKFSRMRGVSFLLLVIGAALPMLVVPMALCEMLTFCEAVPR